MYFITCFEKIQINEYNLLDIGKNRTIGFMKNFQEIENLLNQNNCDLRECLYDYIIVEKIPLGFYPISLERYFFKWNKQNKGFFKIEEPKEFEKYYNIALG